MRYLLILLFILSVGCGGSTPREAIAHFYGTGTVVSWDTDPNGEWASCGDTLFPAPDNGTPATCHWSCGEYQGKYQSVWVDFEVENVDGLGHYTGNVDVKTNPICFMEDPS